MIFLRLLLRRWWIIILILFTTLLSTVVLTYFQTPIYSSAATYVVAPSTEILDGTGLLSGLSVLGGQPSVANTYASIAASAFVKQKASGAMGLGSTQTRSLSVFSRVQTGTNIIEITVEGNDPLLVRDFTTKIGESTVDYVNNLNGVYTLALLDRAMAPVEPIKPNKKLNLIMGAALGLVQGVGIAFLTGLNEY